MGTPSEPLVLKINNLKFKDNASSLHEYNGLSSIDLNWDAITIDTKDITKSSSLSDIEKNSNNKKIKKL